jgi:hypothetical protein
MTREIEPYHPDAAISNSTGLPDFTAAIRRASHRQKLALAG